MTIPYSEIDPIVSTTHNTVNSLIWEANWWDALLLYFRYIQQRKMQNNVDTLSYDSFMQEAMGRWKQRFYNAKKILIEKWMIETVRRSWEDGKIEWRFVKVKYVITGLFDQSLVSSESGEVETNTLIENINTLVENTNTLSIVSHDEKPKASESEMKVPEKKKAKKINWLSEEEYNAYEPMYKQIAKASQLKTEDKRETIMNLRKRIKEWIAFETILAYASFVWQAISIWVLDAQYQKRLNRWVRDIDFDENYLDNPYITSIITETIKLSMTCEIKWIDRKWKLPDIVQCLWLSENWTLVPEMWLFYKKQKDWILPILKAQYAR